MCVTNSEDERGDLAACLGTVLEFQEAMTEAGRSDLLEFIVDCADQWHVDEKGGMLLRIEGQTARISVPGRSTGALSFRRLYLGSPMKIGLHLLSGKLPSEEASRLRGLEFLWWVAYDHAARYTLHMQHPCVCAPTLLVTHDKLRIRAAHTHTVHRPVSAIQALMRRMPGTSTEDVLVTLATGTASDVLFDKKLHPQTVMRGLHKWWGTNWADAAGSRFTCTPVTAAVMGSYPSPLSGPTHLAGLDSIIWGKGHGARIVCLACDPIHTCILSCVSHYC